MKYYDWLSIIFIRLLIPNKRLKKKSKKSWSLPVNFTEVPIPLGCETREPYTIGESRLVRLPGWMNKRYQDSPFSKVRQVKGLPYTPKAIPERVSVGEGEKKMGKEMFKRVKRVSTRKVEYPGTYTSTGPTVRSRPISPSSRLRRSDGEVIFSEFKIKIAFWPRVTGDLP